MDFGTFASFGAREMCGESSGIGTAQAFLSASVPTVQTIDGEPLLHALSSCMMGVVVFALVIDLLKNQARTAEARNRKQISLERLKSKVDARARVVDGAAREKPTEALERQSAQRQSALCTSESEKPTFGPMVSQKNSRHCFAL